MATAVAAGKRVARSPAVERMGRWGLVARAALYLVVAALALQIARGDTGDKADKDGALQAVARQPTGKWLLLLLALGFAGYSLWRAVEAVTGPTSDDDDGEIKRTGKRVVYAGKAALYAALAISAFHILTGSGQGGSGGKPEADWTAKVLGWPAGQWLVGAVGLAIVAAGMYVLWRGVSTDFTERLKDSEIPDGARPAIVALGLAGMAARGIVFTAIGVFIVRAAMQFNPQEAEGIDGALRRLTQASHGTAILTAVAIGLAAYGLYSLAEARYRRVAGR